MCNFVYLLLGQERYKIRTLYVQLDHVSSKCWTVFAGSSALVSLGIVRKVKLSYCLVGRTHEDIDAIIGKIGNVFAQS